MAISTTTSKKSQESPADNSYAVTPHDTNEVWAYLPRAIYVGGAGDINMMLEGDEQPTLFVSVPAGAILPLKARVIMATGTTATSIVALF